MGEKEKVKNEMDYVISSVCKLVIATININKIPIIVIKFKKKYDLTFLFTTKFFYVKV